MKLIPLTQGLYTKVDDEDFKIFAKHRWYAARHGDGGIAARRNIYVDGKQKGIYLHREIMSASDGLLVDHINHDRLDNRKSNLRVCTKAENNRNQRIPKNNTSGYKGVSWYKYTNRWAVDIGFSGRRKRIGYFKTKKEAAQAYDNAAAKHFGEFAKLNLIH